MIADKKLGKTITEKLGIKCKTGETANELLRCIRFQMQSLLTGLDDSELKQMQLGLAHSISRYTLSFTSEKVDTMIIQAVSLLEDLDKELNNYAMRLREWYSWHFPEMAKIITDNTTYAKAVILIGMRTNVKGLTVEQLSEVVGDEDYLRAVTAAIFALAAFMIYLKNVTNEMKRNDPFSLLSNYWKQGLTHHHV